MIAPVPVHCFSITFNGTKAYEEISIDEKSVVYSHSNEIPKKFAIYVKAHQDRLPTMYWLPKLHKRPYKATVLFRPKITP